MLLRYNFAKIIKLTPTQQTEHNINSSIAKSVTSAIAILSQFSPSPIRTTQQQQQQNLS